MARRHELPASTGRRRVAATVLAVTLALAACSAGSDDDATPSTTSAPPTTTTGGSDVTTTTAAPDPTVATTTATPVTEVEPTEPTEPTGTPEDLAVAFVRAASVGDDLSAYIVDPAVADEAAQIAGGPEAEAWEVSIDPEFVHPDAQGGNAGECQLLGDVTLLCPVLVGRPAADGGDPSYTLYGVYATNLDPAAGSPDEGLPPVPYYVVGVEALAG